MILAPITKKNYQVITSLPEALKLISALQEARDVVSFDTESTGAEPKSAKVIGMSFSTKPGSGWYLAIRKWNPETLELEYIFDKEDEDRILEPLFDIMLLKKLIMHNAPYDVTIIEANYGVDLTWALHADTIMMKHTIDEDPPHGLKMIAQRYAYQIGIPQSEAANQEQKDLIQSIINNGGKATKTEYELYKADYRIIGKYACADTDLTLRLYLYFSGVLKETNQEDFFYKKEVMPLMKYATIPMKMRGIMVDLPRLMDLHDARQTEADALEILAYQEMEEYSAAFERITIDEAISFRRTGDFALAGMEYYNLPVPKNRDGRPTMAKPAITKLAKTYSSSYIDWLLWDPKKGPGPQLEPEVIQEIKTIAYQKKGIEESFNIKSPKHLSWLLFDYLKVAIDPTKVSRKTGKPSVDEDVIEANIALKGMRALLALRKIDKQLSTFIRPTLAKNLNGWIYPDMLQFGTNSGRYSCGGGLNLQTLPRDDKRIKSCFIAPPGYKIVSADYSSLEPRIFSWVCGDQGLKEIFQQGLDFYSKIAIDVYKLPEYSSKEDDENFLKKKRPELRQATKEFALAVPYGAVAFLLAMKSGRPVEEHQAEIDAYLDAYPDLVKYMRDQETSAYKNGFVETKFGRIRHLKKAKELYATHGKEIFNKFKMAIAFAGPEGEELLEEMENLKATLYHPEMQDGNLSEEKVRLKEEIQKIRKKIEKLGKEGTYKYGIFRNCMNNAKNSPIQMTAAHCANAAAIKLSATLLKEELDAWMCLQCHDEITVIAREDQAERVAQILQDSMENNWVTRQIDMPIIAVPTICNNLGEAK